jgi:uncharacterized membrane protein YeaQ/YmgE (transglycosylase-associated protein family)
MGLIWIALTGLFVGTLAKWMMPGKDPGGWFVTILLGIGGAWIGHAIAGLLGIAARGLIMSTIVSVLGAMLLLWGYRRWKEKAV